MNDAPRDFRERNENEPAAMKLRMRKRELGALLDRVTYHQEVEIDRARTVMNVAATPEARFDLLTNAEERAGRKGRGHPRDTVDEPRLVRRIDGLGFVEARYGADRNPAFEEELERPRDLRRGLSEIGSESDETVVRGHERLYPLFSSPARAVLTLSRWPT